MYIENTHENEKRNGIPERRVPAEEASSLYRLSFPALDDFVELPRATKRSDKSKDLVYQRSVAVMQLAEAQCGYERIRYNEKTLLTSLFFSDSELLMFEDGSSGQPVQEAFEASNFPVRTITAHR